MATNGQGATTGIGGVFWRARDPVAAAGWFERHLGVPLGTLWPAAGAVLAAFPAEDGYWPAAQPVMLNLRVNDLDALAERLAGAGVAVERRAEWDDPRIGGFGRITGPEGMPVELWQPADALLEAEAAARGPNGQAAYAAAVRALAAVRRPLRAVVLGPKDGRLGCPLHPVLAELPAAEVLLVEPQATLHPALRDSYGQHPGAKVVAAMVGPAGARSYYTVAEPAWERLAGPWPADWPRWRAPAGAAAPDRAAVLDWLGRHLQAGEREAAIAEVEVASAPLPAHLAAQGWPAEVDLLQIDAGHAGAAGLAACALAETRPAVVWVDTSGRDAAAVEAALAPDYAVSPFPGALLAIRRP